MKDMQKILARLAMVAASLGVCSAYAERICYQGFPVDPAANPAYCSGFTTDATAFVPSGASTYVMPATAGDYLEFPSSFAGATGILPVLGGQDDSCVLMSKSGGSKGEGAKVMTLADDCQSRKGELHFRFLIRADQTALDNLKNWVDISYLRPRQHTCGLFWSVDDYTKGAVDNKSLRYTESFGISSEHTDLTGSKAKLNFTRGVMVGLRKDATDAIVMQLCVWGDTVTKIDQWKDVNIASGVVANKTYLCHVRVQIDYFANGDDRISAFVQPTEGYNPSCGWSGEPAVTYVQADLIDGTTGQYAHLVLQGPNDAQGKVQVDEIGLATKASDLTSCDFSYDGVIAYDGFPSGNGGYVAGKILQTAVENSRVFGFSEPWRMYVSKSTPVIGSDALSLPACYGPAGVFSTPGCCLTYNGASDQGMYVRRKFRDNLLLLTTGDILNMRFLISATSTALNKLANGEDTAGRLIPGEVGVQANVNYFGAGIADCSTQIESGNSMAPTLCRRANSCFVTLTKNSDGNVGLYLNLLTEADGTPATYKIANVDATKSATYLCYVRIEVGTGANGKERISGFVDDVANITDQKCGQWFPSDARHPIEHELISATSYPLHAMAGGKVHSGFSFDEFALSIGPSYPLVWAKRPSGIILFVR